MGNTLYSLHNMTILIQDVSSGGGGWYISCPSSPTSDKPYDQSPEYNLDFGFR